TPLHRGPKCRCFAALSWGTGRSAASHAGNYTTARGRQCVVQRENLWFSTLCTFSQRAKAESLETQRAVWGKNKGPATGQGQVLNRTVVKPDTKKHTPARPQLKQPSRLGFYRQI